MDRFALPRLILSLIALALLASGCGPRAASGPAATTARSQPKPEPIRTFKLVGKVLKVEADSGLVTIHHEAIPGYMPAMPMPFEVKDRTLLDDIQPGDQVEGTLRVEPADSYLTDLSVTVPAPPPALKLDLSDGTAKLRPSLPRLEPGREVPDFTMTTQDGQPLRLADLRGEAVALTFIYTRCPLPNFCPRMDQKFGELARMLRTTPGHGAGVRLLSVSFDPEHDTPEVLRRHAASRGARPPLWTFAVAAHDELRKVAEPLGLTYGPTGDQVIHNLTTALIGPDGRLIRRLEGSAWDPADAFRALRAARRPGEAGRRR